MTWNSIMGFVSSFALLLPIFFILVLRLGIYRSFPALLIYYILVLSHNLLVGGYINADSKVIFYLGFANNMLDVPLMLTFLTYFSTSAGFTRRMKIVIAAFVIFEAVIISFYGFTKDAITIVLGPGLLLVFGFCMAFFIRQTKITIMHRKATGKALIAASLLFAYGCFAIIYLMYYVFRTPNVADTFLVYFLVATFSSLLMCAGIIIERKRVQKIRELQLTRKELSMVYNDTTIKKAVPLKTAILDFDKDQWN